ncbi:MAG: uracil phosphoribosyltransferase [Fimbriimonadaceae bacterium]|nr:uracil phosphoribosyltransferase [Fimbriimonadaceae bacterium]
MPLNVVDHPLAQHLLAGLRDKSTPPEVFRRLSWNLTTMLVIEATRAIRSELRSIVTPIKTTSGQILTEGLAVVPVLRAGLGMLEPVVQMFPDVAVGYIGLERNEDTAVARSYYSKLPDLSNRYTLCVDPMLATGGSAAQAVSLIKGHGAKTVVMVCVVAAPEGVDRLETSHPGIHIYTAALDEGLNEKHYIVPGLGDFGDRLYGTF